MAPPPDVPSHWWIHGAAEPPPPPVPLRCGPWSMILVDGDLRYVRYGEREVIRRVYVAVRDRNWGTIPGVISDFRCTHADGGFRVDYTSTQRREDIHFVWQVTITGDADGRLRFAVDGVARSTFLRNRVGLCVLHPIRECAGAACRARHVDGSATEFTFPANVAREQPIQGFTDLAALAHEIEPGTWAELEFEGEAFETEDQRNWTDASFKTYGTPLRLPFPVEIAAGTRVRQAITLGLRSERAVPSRAVVSEISGPGAVRLELRSDAAVRLPEIGLGTASHGERLQEDEITRLSRLGLSHLRVDLRLGEMTWQDRLRVAARDAMELGAALELAVHLPPRDGGELALVAKELLRLKVDLTRVLVLRDGERTTPAADVHLARSVLADCGAALGVGTDANHRELNQLDSAFGADFVAWSMNPQVHAFDNLSLSETPEAVAQQVISVRHRFPSLPLAVTPITLKPRFNAVATSPASTPAVGGLPIQVDPRQLSLFGARWTLGMLKVLAEAGLESVTLFETTGALGVMETAAGSPSPQHFPSLPGSVFPVYHVLADIGSCSMGRVIPTASAPESGLISLLLRTPDRHRLLLAHHRPGPLPVVLPELPGTVAVRFLDAATVREAITAPEHFRARRNPWTHREIEVPPHAILTLDFSTH